jgi:hypothetical protein
MTGSTMTRRTRRRLLVPAIMLAGGGAITAAAAAGGASAALIGTEAGLTLVFSVLFWWAGRGAGDFGALLASRPDERQRSLDLRATAAAGVALAVFCLGAAVVSLARGGSGNPWAAMDAIFAAVYVAALVIFRR